MKTLLGTTLALFMILGMSVGRAADNDTRSKLLEARAAFKELDINANGELSLKEFKWHLAGEKADKADLFFERSDRDNNRSLTFDEYRLGFKRK